MGRDFRVRAAKGPEWEPGIRDALVGMVDFLSILILCVRVLSVLLLFL